LRTSIRSDFEAGSNELSRFFFWYTIGCNERCDHDPRGNSFHVQVSSAQSQAVVVEAVI